MSKKMLSEVAYNALKEKMVNMPSGTYLSARQCANDLGMSYTPVREAFLRLQREGSLRQVPNVGFFVESVDLSDLLQIFQVRECLEVYVMEKVFDKFTQEHVNRMRELCRMQQEMIESGGSTRYMQLDTELHEIPFLLLGNKHLTTLLHNVREQYMMCSVQVIKTMTTDAMTEHAGFIDAIERGDKQTAVLELKAHIENAKQRMMDRYINKVG
ncbi:MAG: GntR family transcriptional regulator [Bacillota bacterium]